MKEFLCSLFMYFFCDGDSEADMTFTMKGGKLFLLKESNLFLLLTISNSTLDYGYIATAGRENESCWLT